MFAVGHCLMPRISRTIILLDVALLALLTYTHISGFWFHR